MSQIRYFQFQRVITLKVCNTELSANVLFFVKLVQSLKEQSDLGLHCFTISADNKRTDMKNLTLMATPYYLYR